MDTSKAFKENIPPKYLGLLELIRAKREWQWRPNIQELKLGFRGWHQRGYLPHFDAPNVTQLLTIMLADSFPITRKQEWESVKNDASESEKRKKLENWLDRGHGDCWLRRPEIAETIENTILEKNGEDYQLQAWAIMPNHLHAVIDVWQTPLSSILKSWKGKSSRLANAFLKRRGAFWQEDYYDTIVRDEEHLKKAVRYVENNPAKARLCKANRDWRFSSAWRRDRYERLSWQKDPPERGLKSASTSNRDSI
jgi:REP element-mobilizing transposase RayT